MRPRGSARDLIEAGLSEPAGWRNGLWGLCCRHLAREAAACDRVAWCAVTRVGDGDGWRPDVVVLGAAVPSALAVTIWPVTSAVAGRGQSPSGVRTARRSIWSGNVATLAGHDVSCQKDGREGGDRHGLGRVVRLIAVLPQQGQRWLRSMAAASSVGEGSGSDAGTVSSVRQSASLSAR